MCVHGMVGDSRSVWPGAARPGTAISLNMVDFATNLHARSGSDDAPTSLDDAYRLWEFEHGKWLWQLPLAELPDSRLGPVGPFWRHWLAHLQDDPLGFHARVGGAVCVQEPNVKEQFAKLGIL